jgi:hypothetical protein
MNEKIHDQLSATRRRLANKRWTCQGDLWDLDKAIKLIEQGKDKQAASFIDNWDTGARDELRECTWNWVQDTLCPEKPEVVKKTRREK